MPDAEGRSPLPAVFCWTKFGTESGEPIEAIFGRKEDERRMNGGLFLWGIGNSVRPSMIELVGQTDDPEVVFTPTLSSPRGQDLSPSSVFLWTSARGLDGSAYELPPHSIVTSGTGDNRIPRRHFALVCCRDTELEAREVDSWIHSGAIRNLISGRPVGSSQVTSVVKRVQPANDEGRRYEVALRARLQPPYLVTLEDPVEVPSTLSTSHANADRRDRRLERLRAYRDGLSLTPKYT